MIRELFACLAFAGLVGCEPDLTSDRSKPELDKNYFRCKVQPVLVKSCGAFLCHADSARFFRVFGRNRLRYGLPAEDRNTPLEDREIDWNYESARAFVDLDAPDRSLLLMKPLDQSAGGYYHGGATEYSKGDVFLSTDEADYQILARWIDGETEADECVEPGL